jgi:hypothetical protein
MTVSGSLTVLQGITGSLFGTSSWAISSSQAVAALSASFALNATSASFANNATTASFALNATSASFANNATTASFAISASQAANSVLLNGTGSSIFATTGSNVFRGNQTVTGSLFTTGSNTLVGSTTLTGSFSVTGSTIQIGNNTLQGLTTLTGSISMSGSIGMVGSITASSDVNIGGVLKLNSAIDPGNFNETSSYLFTSGSNTTTGFDLYYRQQDNLVKFKWLEGGISTGLLYGGVISYSGSTIFVKPGSGIINNNNASTGSEISPIFTYVNWGPYTASATYLTSSQNTYLYVDASGSIFQQTSFFNQTLYEQAIPLGRVTHPNFSSITGVGSNVQTTYDSDTQQNDFIRAFGPIKVSGFSILPQTGSLRLGIGSGIAYNLGGFYTQDPNSPSHYESVGFATASIARAWRSGSGVYLDNNGGAFYNTVDPDYWDDGTGTLNTMNAGDWQIQRVFANPVTGRVVVYYGQTGTYSNLLNALQYLATDPFEEGEFTAKSLVFVGYLVLKGQTNNLTDTTNNRIINAGIFRNIAGGSSGGSAVAQTLNDLSDVLITTPSNGQALIYDSGNWINGIPTSASFASTASFVQNAQTASFVLNAVSASFASTASYILNAVSASFATTSVSASYALNAANATTASYVLNAVSASFATTSVSASFATNAANATTASYVLQAVSASFATNAANATTASYVLNAVSASFASTASYVLNAVSASFASTASYVLNAVSASFASTASYVLNAVSASFATNATTASYALNATSASFALTASSADNFTVRGTLTAQTIVAQTITSSIDFVTGSTRFGSSLSNTHQFTGSVSITGSLTLPYLSTGSILFAGATDNITEDNTNLFWDNTNKRLGIGTNAPSRPLHLVGSSALFQNAGTFELDLLNTVSGNYLRLVAGTADSNIGTIQNIPFSFIMNGSRVGQFTSTNGNLILQNGGTFTDGGQRLQVSGSGYFSDTLSITSNTSTSYALNLIGRTTAGNASTINFFNNAASTRYGFIYVDSSSYEIGSISGSNIPLIFSTNQSERMRLDTSGNLGLGVTPSAYSLGKVVEVGTLGNAFWGLGINSVQLTSNYFYDGSYKYANNGYANRYDIGSSGGSHIWFNAPSGTAGNVISFTQAMTLTAGGNLLVGGTSDNGSRVQINSGGANTIVGLSVLGANSESTIAKFARGGSEKPFYISSSNNTFVNLASEGALKFKVNVTADLPYSSGIDAMTIASTGAATFSSSVTLTDELIFAGASVDTSIKTFASNNRDRLRIKAYNEVNLNSDVLLSFNTGGSERMRITTAGNVGIGTTSPLSLLNVQAASNTNLSLTYTVNSGANYTQLSGGSINLTNKWATIQFKQDASEDAHHIIFSTANSSTNTTERVRITSSGSVGIGTTTPTLATLQVNGNVYATSFTGSFSGSIANAVSASYAATASYATNFTIGSTLIIDQTLTDYASVGASSVGSNNLFSQNTGSYTSAFFKYTCASASNARSGEVVAVWNGTTAQFYDNSTVDVGNTTAVTSSAVIVTGQIQFNMQTNTSGWAIKSIATFM